MRGQRSWRVWCGAALTVALMAYAAVLAFTFVHQDQRVYFPPPRAAAPFDIRLPRPGGIALGGWVIPGPRAGAALVVFGGNAQALAPLRDRQGLAGCTDRTLILVPYRGYEGNPGVPREADLIDDGRAVVAWVKARYPRVGLLGISLGSGVATAVAADDGAGVDMLALGTPYDRLDRVAQDLVPWLWPQVLMRDRYSSVERIGRVQAPVFVLRADGDALIKAERTRALLAAAGRRARETVIRGGHEDAWRTQGACTWLRAATGSARG